MFEHKGIVELSPTGNDKQLADMDPLELAIEVGAEDVSVKSEDTHAQGEEEDGGSLVQLKCEPNELNAVCSAVREKGLAVSSASLDYLPKSVVSLTGEQFEKAEKLVELLSEQNDVVSVYSNHTLDTD